MAGQGPTRLSSSAPRVEHDLGRWKSFLREQEHLCAEHRFGAALVTVGLAPRRGDDSPDLDAVVAMVEPLLRDTDRIGVLCPTELSLLLVPLESIHHAKRLVESLDRALRGAGTPAHVGWAMRQDGHGLFHAAARADAAMLTARGHGRATVDLSEG